MAFINNLALGSHKLPLFSGVVVQYASKELIYFVLLNDADSSSDCMAWTKQSLLLLLIFRCIAL
jgi:hypothetical protein